MVFNGHDHVYERSVSNGIQYVIAGSGGVPQYDVNIKPNPNQIYAEKILHFCKLSIDGSSLIFEMIRPDGSIGDTFSETESTAVTVSNKLSITWGKIKSAF